MDLQTSGRPFCHRNSKEISDLIWKLSQQFQFKHDFVQRDAFWFCRISLVFIAFLEGTFSARLSCKSFLKNQADYSLLYKNFIFRGIWSIEKPLYPDGSHQMWWPVGWSHLEQWEAAPFFWKNTTDTTLSRRGTMDVKGPCSGSWKP